MRLYWMSVGLILAVMPSAIVQPLPRSIALVAQAKNPMSAQSPETQFTTTLEVQRLNQEGERFGNQGQYLMALDTLQKALKLARDTGNHPGEAKALKHIAEVYAVQGQKANALELLQQALQIYQELGDRAGEGGILTTLGSVQISQSKISNAKETLQQALTVLRTPTTILQVHKQQRYQEAETLVFLGILKLREQHNEATKLLDQALSFSQETGNRKAQAYAYCLQGILYVRQNNLTQALTVYQKADKISQELERPVNRIYTLQQIGAIYTKLKQYPEALKTYQQALKLARVTNKTEIASKLLQAISVLQSDLLKQPQQAVTLLKYYQQALEIARKSSDSNQEANALNEIGKFYVKLKKTDLALRYHQQALIIFKKLANRDGEAATLGYIGNAFFNSHQYQKVADFFQEQLATYRAKGDRVGEEKLLAVIREHLKKEWGLLAAQGTSANYILQRKMSSREISWTELLDISKLNLSLVQEVGDIDLSKSFCEGLTQGNILHGIGWSYFNFGDYPQALNYMKQALALQKKKSSKNLQLLLVDLGTVYISLGQYPLALSTLQESLALKDQECQCNALSKIGYVYKELGQYDLALQYLQKALLEFQNDSDRHNVLNNLGEIYFQKGKYSNALEFFNEALDKSSISGEQSARGFILNNIGLTYVQMGKPEQAFKTYQEALFLFRELNDRSGQRLTLSNIAALLEKKGKAELAISFYKEAVNVTESIRKNLHTLTVAEQKTYTETVADTYRRLADLLLSQGRVPEAQQVLELLKIQEIRNYTRDSRAGEQSSGIATNPIETQVLKTYGTLIAFGQKVAECEKANCNQLSQLHDQREALNEDFNRAVKKLEETIRAKRGKDGDFTNPKPLFDNPDQIVSAQPGTLLIQTLVLPDKLWVLWASQGGVTQSIEVSVSQKQLSETVLKFRESLQTPHSDLKDLQATAQQLYSWLVPPKLQVELKANPIQHLVFSLDHVTRYIPMAALFDGQQYLTERYTLSTIISTNTARNFLPLRPQTTSVLALGLSEAKQGFSPLPNVPAELDAIVQKSASDSQGIYPGEEYLNQAFTWRTLRDNLATHQILHIATHGKFEPGNADESFLVLGDGTKLPIPKIDTLKNLGNLSLVVLSACETALGGEGKDGAEIPGISSYFLSKGTKTVLASLWSVNDTSTSQLMQQFYSNLAKSTERNPITKAEALRQAQLALLKNPSLTRTDTNRTVVQPMTANQEIRRDNQPSAPGFTHPYYWAPFILIGNSL